MRLIDVPMGENDVNANTVGDFLGKLLVTLWEEAECFSGKRPFGNSDWQYQVYASLIKAGYEIGELDEYGDVVSLDYSKADEIIADAIMAVFAEPVKHGRWIEEIEFDCKGRPCGCHFRCSICNKVEDDATHYCPNCGAKMDLTDINVGNKDGGAE